MNARDKARGALAVVGILFPGLAHARDALRAALAVDDGSIDELERSQYGSALRAMDHMLLAMLFTKFPPAAVQWGAFARLLLAVASNTSARWDQHIRHDIGDSAAESLIECIEAVFHVKREGEKRSRT